MPELVFTVARFGLLILLWVFVFVVARAIRRDVFASAGGRGGAAPAVAAGDQQAGKKRPKQQQRQQAASTQHRQLVVTEGEMRGKRIPLASSPIRMGRSPDSTLVISDDFASARHAQLVPRGGQWILEDLGSTNGTYLGQNKVTTPTPIPPGVPIRIGRTSIELHP